MVIRRKKHFQNNVNLILGVYNDRQKVIDEIVAASNLPLSIIIVGVGVSFFSFFPNFFVFPEM